MPRRRRGDDSQEENTRPRRRTAPSREEDDAPRASRRGAERSRPEPETDSRPKRSSSSKETGGWAKLRQKAEERELAKDVLNSKIPNFRIKAGEFAFIQFTHDEPMVVETHQTKNKYGRYETQVCQKETGKHCVMCDKGMGTSTKAAFKVLDFRGRWDKDQEDFSWDEPLERLLWASQSLAIQIHDYAERKGVALSEAVIEIARSGSGAQDTSYSLSPALDEDNHPVEPLDLYEFEMDFPPIEEVVVPLTDEELEAIGFSNADDFNSSDDKPKRGASKYSKPRRR